MEYRVLDERGVEQIALRKLLDLESNHASLDLDVRLAVATGIDGEPVAQGRQRLALLTLQISTLATWLWPPTENEQPTERKVERRESRRTASSNGKTPAAV